MKLTGKFLATPHFSFLDADEKLFAHFFEKPAFICVYTVLAFGASVSIPF